MPKINFKRLRSISVILIALFFTAEIFLNVANAQKSVYEMSLRPNEKLSIRSWVTSALITATIDYPLKIACGGENDKETMFIDNTSSTCVPPLGFTGGTAGRSQGGLLALAASVADQATTDPIIPTNLALYYEKNFKNTIFNTNETFAQTDVLPEIPEVGLSKTQKFFSSTTYEAWVLIRNLSLSLLGVAMALGALAILFRTKLSPQAVFTITNLIPYVPLALLGIVLSYPIVALALNVVPLLSDVSSQVANSAARDIQAASAGNTTSGFTASGIYGMVGTVIAAISISTLSGIGIILSLPIIVIFVLLIFLIVWLLIRMIIEYVNIFVVFVFITLAMPVVAVLTLLPKRQKSLVNLFKKLLANILVWPVMTFLFTVGMAFISIMLSGTSDVDWGISIIGGSANIVAAFLKFAIGFTIAMAGLNSRKYVESFFGVSGPMSALFSAEADAGGGGKPPRR